MERSVINEIKQVNVFPNEVRSRAVSDGNMSDQAAPRKKKSIKVVPKMSGSRFKSDRSGFITPDTVDIDNRKSPSPLRISSDEEIKNIAEMDMKPKMFTTAMANVESIR